MKKQNVTEQMIDDADLYDSETTDLLRAEDLGISDLRYRQAVRESLESDQAEGHIVVDGRRVYAETTSSR